MAQPFTVFDAMINCRVDNNALFQQETQATRIARDIFNDDFNSCMNITYDEFDADLKSFSSLTAANGRITLNPQVKRNIKAFIQWTRDHIRTGVDPSTQIFDVNMVIDLTTRNKLHQSFIDKSKTIMEAAKPKHFTEKLKWDDWFPTFQNFLKCIPGRNGQPLLYVITKDSERSNTFDPNIDILENYIKMAPLDGEAFKIDASEVHTYLMNFIAGNITAETKVLPHASECNGRKDIFSLIEHYEGVGIHSVNVIKAEEIISSLFYSGEKRPHMWWDEFERQLTYAFTIIDKKEGRQVYSDNMKLRIVTKKVQADFLTSLKAGINIELTKTPITFTYAQALSAFRNEVNRKFPPEMASKNNTRARRINETSRNGGRGGGRGRGRGGRGNGGRGGGKTPHPEERKVTGIDGRTIRVHPSYDFPRNIWFNLPDNERKRVTTERANYRNNKRPRNVSEMNTPNNDNNNNGNGSAAQQQQRPPNTANDGATFVSEISTGTGMGGRNEQASLRSRNTNGGGR